MGPSIPAPKKLVRPLQYAALGAAAVGTTAGVGSLRGRRGAAVGAACALGGLAGYGLLLARDSRVRLMRLEKEFRASDGARTATMERLTGISQAVGGLRGAVAESRRAVLGELAGESKRLRKVLANETRQLEALIQLQKLLPVAAPIPATRGWAASPDLLLAYVQEIVRTRPDLVVECGSGVSTLYAALALEAVGAEGRVVSLDHDPGYAEKTRAVLRDHDVAHRAEVRDAPIEDLTVAGRVQPWYQLSALKGLDDIGLLFVDGPLGSLHPESRYPALPLLRERLLPGSSILLDDSDREGETAVADHWRADFPELEYARLATEKGTIQLRVPR